MVIADNSPRATPTIPTGGVFSPYAEVKINGSAHNIIEAIVDTRTWPKWNTFVPLVEITNNGDKTGSNNDDGPSTSRLVKGTHMTLHVQMTESFKTASKEIVHILETPFQDSHSTKPGDRFRVCWTFANSPLVPRFMLHAERVNEIEVLDDGCLYRTWETFGGPAAKIVKWKFEEILQQRFEDWAHDLKAYIETAA